MKKFAIILTTAILVFACNSANKETSEKQSQSEVNLENLVELTIPVHGMTCEGCENAVKKSVQKLDGIAEISASHSDSVAIVKFDKAMVTPEEIKGKIKEAGYTVAQ